MNAQPFSLAVNNTVDIGGTPASKDRAAVALPPIPAKKYFTIGEVSDLCEVKSHVLRYWEQEFSQLKPLKRGGNRRYYQRNEVMLIRRIRELLYERGYTIKGVRAQLDSGMVAESSPDTMLMAQKDMSGNTIIKASQNADLNSVLPEVTQRKLIKELRQIAAMIAV